MKDIYVIYGTGEYGIDLYEKIIHEKQEHSCEILFADTFHKGETAINNTIILDDESVKKYQDINAKVYIATKYYDEIFSKCIREKIRVDGIYWYETHELKSYKMIKKMENKYQNKILKNLYKTEFNKNVLISYILEPFDSDFNGYVPHANFQHSIAMSEVFKEMQFNVDIVQYNTILEIDCEKYDIIIGFGNEFEKFILSGQNKKATTIAFLTGASPYFNNIAELERLTNFEKRHEKNIFALQRVEVGTGKGDLLDLKCLKLIDYAICVGNEWTINTYRNMFRHDIFSITPTGLNVFGYVDRNFKITRNNFLWFGGSSEIHKGLDLCIEYFALNEKYNLYIAGNLSCSFYNYYRKELQMKNIHYVGHINVAEEKYYKLCEVCCFTILPSCSEANSTAVLTNMFSGMIPVLTKEAGITLVENGFEIKTGTLEGIKLVVEEIENASDMTLKEMSMKSYNIAIANHTTEKFKVRLKSILNDIEHS